MADPFLDWDETTLPSILSSPDAPKPTARSMPRLLDYAVERVQLMFCYLKTSYNYDTTALPMAMAEVLSHYPKEVIEKVTAPTGLASKNEWPSLKELRDACEDAAKHWLILQKEPLPVNHGPLVYFKPDRANLFSPVDTPHHGLMMAWHQEFGGPVGTHCERRRCTDGREHYGVWIPKQWYEAACSGAPCPDDPVWKAKEDELATKIFREKFGITDDEWNKIPDGPQI